MCWLKIIFRYREAEIDAFEDALSEKASAQAKLIVDHYFSKPRDKLQWDQIAVINDKVCKCFSRIVLN